MCAVIQYLLLLLLLLLFSLLLLINKVSLYHVHFYTCIHGLCSLTQLFIKIKNADKLVFVGGGGGGGGGEGND